ncbi:hypothetical protein AK812_SmicGene49046 [Symbiodinium microadriaticum]|uniref:TNFR-Cys domain-containing protein n=1 Tax=Symbiodinium microadriaticum TaxID=2951 RepID=A0A1Q9C261_SYMMI|nr:hypothetical protein AK812_SmicGene49046 [Symbiodinium microadriaticum]
MFKTARLVGTFLLALHRAGATCLADNKLKLKTCGNQCSESKDRVVCVSSCLQKQDVVTACADCLGSEFDCGSRFCGSACEGGHRSGACESCLHSQCTVCSTELDFQAHTANLGDALAEAVEVATPPADNDTAAVKMLAESAGSCASSGALISSCGTPCYSTTDPAGCYAKCAMRACFSGCYECSSTHCFESCRRSFSSYECATCVSGFCGGCTVQTGMKDSIMLP